jgi:hypothetical protein
MDFRNHVIFAPHCDDELIGCYRYLRDGVVSTVYYFCELTPARMEEAKKCASIFGFEPIFVTDVMSIEIPSNTVLLLPSVKDAHPHHKVVNRLGSRYRCKHLYYSVDMGGKFDVLMPLDRARKEAFLKNIYPSQAKLFENEKYFLFEHVVEDESSKMIWVTFQKHGLHRYPSASTGEGLEDVAYLGSMHRHLFKFRVDIEVFHDDREIEFHQFQNWLIDFYNGSYELDHKSCEMIADHLAKVIQYKYQGRRLIIEVSEDGENGCRVEYPA